MRLALPNSVRRPTRFVFATVAALVLVASTTLAQFGTFNPAFDGELWGVRHQLVPAGDDVSVGVAFVGGTLYVVERGIGTIVAYDSAGQIVAKPGAQWDTTDPGSPVADMVFNRIEAAVVVVDGTDHHAILASDAKTARVAAFTTAGAHLFTLRMARPTNAPLYQTSIGELAMSAGARFSFATATNELSLSGKFAVAWFEQIMSGAVDSGAMVFEGPMSFPVIGVEFQATPAAIKRGNEHDPVMPAPQRVIAVDFDTIGNLYALDAFTERLNVYGPALNHLLTFGTPIADGTTAEFSEPWGMAFWPDLSGHGGRILVNDTYKRRILIYRPIDTPSSAPGIDAFQAESVIKGFLPASPALYPNAIAVDRASGSIAITDFAEDDIWYPRTVVLRPSALAAFNFQVLDAGNGVVESVCTASDYRIRFSLTVPAGNAAVTEVTPRLLIDGVPTAATAEPADVYPSTTLQAGQVVTYTYSLTAPGAAGEDLAIVAGATAGNTSDVLHRAENLAISDCAGETDPSTISAAPSAPPQVSGWTPVYEGGEFSVTLTAQDDDGIESVEYRLEGANESGDDPIATDFDGVETDATLTVPFVEFGRTALSYRVRDGNGIWSGWQTLKVRTKLVVNPRLNENVDVVFRIGDPEGAGFTYSVAGLPAGVTFSTATGQFGGVISFDANNPYSSDPTVASGIYHVVVTETDAGGATSDVAFTWTVNNINRHPTLVPILPSQIPRIVKGEPFELNVEGYDPDGDAAFFTAHGRSLELGYDWPPTVTIDPASGTISGTFPINSEPSYMIQVGLSECAGTPLDHPVVCVGTQPRLGLATVMEITVEVANVNQPPDVVNPGPQFNTQGQTITPLQIVASDPDVASGDVLEYLATNLPAGLSIDSATGLISGTVSLTAAPSYAVTVVVRDQAAVLPLPSVTFAWTIADDNTAPTVSSPDRVSLEGETTNVTIAHGDADNDPLTFTMTGLPATHTINNAGVISGLFNYQSAGDYVVTVTVSDGEKTASTTFNWKVFNVNRPPSLTVTDQVSVEGQTVTLPINGSDSDNDPLTFTMNGLPPSLTIDSSTGVISGTFGPGSAGLYTVNVGVADSAAGVVKVFRWTVTEVPPNQPPVCSAAQGGEIWPPNHKRFYVAGVSGVTDPENHPFTIVVTGIWQDEQLDSTGDGKFSPDGRIENGTAWVRAERNGHGNKAKGDGRVYEILFTATDSLGASCSGSVLWTVPHDQGKRGAAVDSVVRYDSTGVIPGARHKSQIHQTSSQP